MKWSGKVAGQAKTKDLIFTKLALFSFDHLENIYNWS